MTIELSPEEERTVDDMRGWLDDNKAAYEDAVTNLGDPEYVRGVFNSLLLWLADVMAYNPVQHNSESAVFIIGRFQAKAGGLLTDIQLMNQYEEEKARFESAVDEIERKAPRDRSRPDPSRSDPYQL